MAKVEVDHRALVDKWSNSEIGYLHIRPMNAASLRQFERDLTELHLKKAVDVLQEELESAKK